MKVLVTAASRHGSTAEIASIIASVLRAADLEVDVVEPGSVDSVIGYDAVIVGSGVYAGHWLGSATTFIDRYEEQLSQRPVFLFSSGPLGEPLRPIREPSDIIVIDEMTGALDHQVFAGRLMQSNLSRREQYVATVTRAPYGDFRPWDDIAAWAQEIARFVRGGSEVAQATEP